MNDRLKKNILGLIWILFIILTISIYTFQALVHSQSNISNFLQFLGIIIGICLFTIFFALVLAKYRIYSGKKYPLDDNNQK